MYTVQCTVKGGTNGGGGGGEKGGYSNDAGAMYHLIYDQECAITVYLSKC